MQTWIFQGNPDDFDIDGYLASRPAEVVWLAEQYAREIEVGDRVFLWRNQGKRKAIAGVIAEATVVAAPVLRNDAPESVGFWREPGPRATEQRVRAALRLIRVATSGEGVKRDWCRQDPILRGLPNLLFANATNFKLTTQLAHRLEAVWNKTGRDWSRNECVAALWAYANTSGGPVSQTPNSPVANVAIQTGRAVSSVYAKVMNFRAIDPHAPSAGMSGGSTIDKLVWAEFFDPTTSTLQVARLNEEFARIWPKIEQAEQALPEAGAAARSVSKEAEQLEALSLDYLLAKYVKQRAIPSKKPNTRVLSTTAYERDPLVIAIARKRAKCKCELTECKHPGFMTKTGEAYTEVHHIVPLADGGEDTIENVACLCPSHHREAHLGTEAPSISAKLLALRSP